MTETIYIPLEDEGVPVRRPAKGYRRDDGRYIVLRPADYDPTLENWVFPPGTIVECETQQSNDGNILTAVRSVAEADLPDRRAI